MKLIGASTLQRDELDGLLAYFREGGPANMRGLVGRLATLAGYEKPAAEPAPVSKAGFYLPGKGIVDLADIRLSAPETAPVVPLPPRR